MRFGRITLFSAFLISSLVPALASPHSRRGPTSSHLFSKRTAVKKPISQRSIDSDRTTQIQTALISQGYMTGSPSGTWDSTTQAALQKLQGDNGWQTKFVPDSRAIIKLGLGPNNASSDTASFLSSSAAMPSPRSHEAETESLPAQR